MTTPALSPDESNAVNLAGEPALGRSSGSPLVQRRKIVIMLPAYNEGEALGPLLEAIDRDLTEAGLWYEVIVVDDGSADDTALVASQASFHMPVTCVTHDVNQGLAAALRTGFNAAIEASRPGDIIITMDADNTHMPATIVHLASMIRQGHDIAIASRYQRGARTVGVPWNRNLMSLGARFLFTTVFPITGVRDYTCGYRAYRHELLAEANQYYGDRFVSEQGFSCMVDVLLKLRRYEPVMGETPLILRYDQKGGVSKMKVAKTAWQTLKLIARRKLKQS